MDTFGTRCIAWSIIYFKHGSFVFSQSLFLSASQEVGETVKQLHVKTHLCCFKNCSLYPQVSCFMNRSPGSVRFFSKKNVLIANQLQAEPTNQFIKIREEKNWHWFRTAALPYCMKVRLSPPEFTRNPRAGEWKHNEIFLHFDLRHCMLKSKLLRNVSSSYLQDVHMEWFPIVSQAAFLTHLQWGKKKEVVEFLLAVGFSYLLVCDVKSL